MIRDSPWSSLVRLISRRAAGGGLRGGRDVSGAGHAESSLDELIRTMVEAMIDTCPGPRAVRIAYNRGSAPGGGNPGLHCAASWRISASDLVEGLRKISNANGVGYLHGDVQVIFERDRNHILSGQVEIARAQ
jgi:hypothetical protein